MRKINRKRKRKNKILKISKVLSLISLIVLVIFLFILYNTNILPIKYFAIISIILFLLDIIYMLLSKNKKIKSVILIFSDVIAVIVIIIECFGSFKIYQAYNFLDNDFKVQETQDVYYIVVNSNSSYDSLKKIENEIVYYYNDSDNFDELEQSINKKIKVNLKEVNTYSDLIPSLIKDKDRVILISEASYYAFIDNQEEKYEDNLRIIDKIRITKKLKTSKSSKDITKNSFTIYLSGIDTRSDSMPSRSLSDVNMFIVVNPQTRNVLIVNIPRDYYVQLHGTTGLKDKLTHAGIVGGVNLSKQTIEDILGYDADYYIRVNFNSVIKLVDAIGGITINSDVDYKFTCWTDSSCVFKPGDNKVDGKCALAFARERHAYTSGDIHRGENQQQVIKLIVDKLTSSRSLIANYDKLLTALNGTFESDISTNNITSLVQFQLNDMRGWNFITSNLDGTTGYDVTYSYPTTELSVMYPNQKSITTAKEKIKEILNEN